MREVAVFGGGISGLSAAYFAKKRWKDARVTVHEASDRLGGAIDAIKEPVYFERGPRTFRRGGAKELLEVIEDLGLETVEASKTAKKRYIISGGELTPLPSAPWQLFTTKLGRIALGGLIRDYYARPLLTEETIGDFARRRFGKKMTEHFFDPMVKGIFAGDLDALSVSACFPFLKAWEKKYGSIVKGAAKEKSGGGLFTIRGGIVKLVDAMAEGIEVKYHETIDRVEKQGDVTICALPLSTLQKIESPHREIFSEIKTASLMVCHFAFTKSVILPPGFGYLAPRKEEEKILGVVFDSEIFPHENREGERRVSVMMPITSDPVSVAKEALQKHLGIFEEPFFSDVTKYKDAIPQYRLGHEALVAPLLQDRTILWTGNYLNGVSVNACVKRSKQALESM